MLLTKEQKTKWNRQIDFPRWSYDILVAISSQCLSHIVTAQNRKNMYLLSLGVDWEIINHFIYYLVFCTTYELFFLHLLPSSNAIII